MSIDTAIESMIESYIDDQDFVSRTDASMEAESYTDQCIGDIQDELGVLMVRLEALEEFKALEDKAREDKALDLLDTVARAEIDSVRAKALEEQEPRAVNQIDWIMTTHGLIAGYDSKAMLESYVRSVLPADQSHQAEMLIAMVLTTARNLINKKLEAES
jgi:phosphoglycerate dehydrogenase-like enzyme